MDRPRHPDPVAVVNLTDVATQPLTATPIWLDDFICQYQMTDTTCCPESILNANRSSRWDQSITTGGSSLYDRDSDQLHFMAESPPVEHEPILAEECLVQLDRGVG